MHNKAKQALPAGWREVRLGDIGDIYSGGTPSTQNANNWGGGIPWLTPSEVTQLPTKYVCSTKRTITQRGLSDTTLLPEKTLIVCTRATIGDVCINTVPMAINQGFKCINPHSTCSVIFLYYLLQIMKNDLVRLGCGSTFREVPKSDFMNFTIPLPPLAEQKAIAAVLSKCDDAIEAAEALITAKQSQFQWLLKTLITDQQSNPHWQAVPLGDMFNNQLKIEKGKLLTRKQMTQGDIPVIAGGQSYSAFHNCHTHNTKTITISGSGAYAGFISFHDYPIFATDCNVITSISEHIIEYVYYAMKIQQEYLYSLQSGGAQPHVYASDIARVKIPLPPIEQQLQIVKILDKSQEEAAIIKQLSAQYRTEKHALMQNLLTGKWRIKK